jgi:peptidoglycan hydrolase-like amidase
MMPIKKIAILICMFLCLIPLVPTRQAYSENLDTPSGDYDQITNQLSQLKDELNKSEAATKPLQSELDKMKGQIKSIKAQVAAAEIGMKVKQKEIDDGYASLAKKQELVLKTISDFYIKSYSDTPLTLFLSSVQVGEKTQEQLYQEIKTQQDKNIITNIALSITDLENKKKELEKRQIWLIATKTSLDEQSAKLDEVVKGALAYQKELNGKIAALTAQQQQTIAQKLAGLNIPRSAGTSARGCSSDLTNGKNPGFSPRLAFFTYGAPHRNGLNQYGALGRAKAGQNEEQILQAYYPNFSLKKDYDQSAQVNVDGNGAFSIEDYVKRIWEVPNSWGDEGGMAALKAQAVAARSYALNSMQRNGHICTTESCQVFKPDPKGGNWEQAVEATKGWVLMDGSNPAFSQYASTHGGYILNLGKFDGDGGNPTNFAELNARAYDRESPWFYCDWGSRSEYDGTAWLKPSEVADIANVIMLARFSDIDKEHLYQPDKPNPVGKETWNADKIKSELLAKGGTPLQAADNVSVSVDFGSGKTNSVNIGGISFSAQEFKDWFNLRAPANIQIVGPLYNVEIK